MDLFRNGSESGVGFVMGHFPVRIHCATHLARWPVNLVFVSTNTRFAGQLRWMQKVRLYPTCAQERTLVEMLRATRELYNALLQQRRDAWTTRRAVVKSKTQYRQITQLRSVEPRFSAVYRECEDAVLRRLDLAFAAFSGVSNAARCQAILVSSRRSAGTSWSFHMPTGRCASTICSDGSFRAWGQFDCGKAGRSLRPSAECS